MSHFPAKIEVCACCVFFFLSVMYNVAQRCVMSCRVVVVSNNKCKMNKKNYGRFSSPIMVP